MKTRDALAPSPPARDLPPVEWIVAEGLTEYADAVAEMEARVAAIAEGSAAERVWLVEHPPLYTAGTSSVDGDLLDARFPGARSGRGGQYTYHGPGQRVAYVMLDLKRARHRGRAGVRGGAGGLDHRRAGQLQRARRAPRGPCRRLGAPARSGRAPAAHAEDKIAAIGIRVRRWVSFHGISLNVEPDLSHFSGIVPCGIARQLRGHQPGRPRPARGHGGRGRGAARRLRRSVRANGDGSLSVRSAP